MKAKDVTAIQFAKWSFKRDKAVGLYPKLYTWEHLPKDEQKLYMEEAGVYLSMPSKDWPLDILERLDK
jgi:hypothetical protein